MFYKDLENRKRAVVSYIKKKPKTTFLDLKRDLHTKIDKVYSGGMAEAFKEAGIKPPRTFERKTKEERQKIIINFIKKNPTASSFRIRKELKINVPSSFKSIKEAYNLAEVRYPRIKSYDKQANEKRKEIIKTIKENPYITLTELIDKTQIKNPYKLFKSFEEMYKKAGIRRIKQGEKIRNRKRGDVIDFIKKSNLPTQREINKNCKTKVQSIFKKGIFEAYEEARIKYPFERLKLYGTTLKEIKKRAKDFEDKISVILSGYGNVNQLVKTKRGVADIILERKKKKIIVEIKDYQNKEISFSQVKQLNKYIEDLDTNLGILICHKKPKKDKFLIGKNKIFILEEQELNKIPKLLMGI